MCMYFVDLQEFRSISLLLKINIFFKLIKLLKIIFNESLVILFV